jgi:Mn-containing catalase
MSDKPSYLGLLNAVSLAESNAHCYLTEWASVTKDPDVRRVLLTVAAREGEHGMTFAKRINELGYELLQRPDDTLEKKLAIVRSDCSDLEKMEALGYSSRDSAEGKPDLFDDFFKDHSIDVQTGELLGRYIAEERDTGRLLRACHQCLHEAADAEASVNGANRQDSKAAKATARRLTAIETKVDQLCAAVEELGKIVRSEMVRS